MQTLIDGRSVGDGARPMIFIDMTDGSIVYIDHRGKAVSLPPKLRAIMAQTLSAIEALATTDVLRRKHWNDNR